MIAGSRSMELAQEERREAGEGVSAMEGAAVLFKLSIPGKGDAMSSQGPGARPDEVDAVEERLPRPMRSDAEKSSAGNERGNGERLRMDSVCESTL